MNKLNPILVALGLSIGLALAEEPPPAAEQIPAPLPTGRYQVIDANFSNAPDAPEKQFRRPVILDTVTGSIKVCDYIYKDIGKQQDGRAYWSATPQCWAFVTGEPVKVPKVK